MEYRDIKQKQQKQFDGKLDRKDITKAVITDEFGNDSGAGTIWADQNTRRVWIREAGSASISQVPCYTITPEIGLGVIVGYDLYSNIREVLRTDRDFLGRTNTTGTSYESPSHLDLQAGGRLQLWIASKLIEPLSTYPDTTGLVVNVVNGDYPYAGERKTFVGQTGITLTQNPNAGEHYYAGLYLDASNALQIIYGASVVLATTPPEPSWPANAFRLSVIRINDTQTSINFSLDTNSLNDIFDRRMAWSGETGSGWPAAGKAMINNTQYDTVQLAIDAMLAGDIIKVGQGTDSGGIVPDTAGSIVGLSPIETIITKSDNDSITVNNSAAVDLTLENLTISQIGAGTSVSCIQSNQNGLRLDNLDILKESGTPTNSTGVSIYGGSGDGTYLLNCRISVTTGTNKYGVYAATAACYVIIEGGEINAATADIYIGHASAVVELRGVKLIGGVINATTGTLRGWAVDDKGRDCGKVVKNTSGATVNRGDVGYLDGAGEFKTTTTANNFTGEEHVVTAGGPNNGWIFVRRSGNATVNYTGTAPNAGEYLVTSTSAGLAQARATMHYSVFAVCLAAGSGGTVEVQMLCGTNYVPMAVSVVYGVVSHDTFDFVATIATLPGGANLTYNAPSSGAANTLVPYAGPYNYKLVLHNTTRGTEALITSVVTGTSTITLTANVPAGWTVGDTITARSQTYTGTLLGSYYYDIDTNGSIPTLSRALVMPSAIIDSGSVGQLIDVSPYQATLASDVSFTVDLGTFMAYVHHPPLVSGRFCTASVASGSATKSTYFRQGGYFVAAP